jgi:ankyrin repeat protein
MTIKLWGLFFILASALRLSGMEEPSSKRQHIDQQIDQQTLDRALRIAAKDRTLRMVEHLVKLGANVNAVGNYGETALHCASWKGNLDIVTFLLKQGASPTIATTQTFPIGDESGGDLQLDGYIEKGSTSLHAAVVGGHLDIAALLMQYGACVSTADATGDTPLHVTLKSTGDTKELVRLLLDQGAPINARDNLGFVPLGVVASSENDIETVQLLLERGAEVKEIPIISEVLCEDLENEVSAKVIELLIKHGASVNDASEHGSSPLCLASNFGNLEVVKMLLKYGADINIDNGSPLCEAVGYYKSPAALVKFLIEQGANVNAFKSPWHHFLNDAGFAFSIEDEEGETLTENEAKKVSLLICNGAKYNSSEEKEAEILKKGFEKYPLVLTVLMGTLEQVKSAAIDATSKELSKALVCAAAQSKKDIVLALLPYFNEDTKSIEKALMRVKRIIAHSLPNDDLERAQSYKIIQEQLTRRLLLCEQIIERPVLYSALLEGIDTLPQELAQKIMSINPTDALFKAIDKGRIDLVSCALKAKANPNAVNKKGTSLLTLAALYTDIPKAEKMVQLLINYGAESTSELLDSLVLSSDTLQRASIIEFLLQSATPQKEYSDIAAAMEVS